MDAGRARVVKEHLPDSHTDFLFAVMAEEFGIVMCLIVVGLYLFLFARFIRAALRQDDVFSRYAIIGLVALLAMQAAINMGVNLQLLPAKGMTLPFLSYGDHRFCPSVWPRASCLGLPGKPHVAERAITGLADQPPVSGGGACNAADHPAGVD